MSPPLSKAERLPTSVQPRLRVVALSLVLALITSLVGSPATAGQNQDFGLAGQSVFVTAEGSLMLWLNWSGSVGNPDLTASVVVHQRVESQDDLRAQPGDILNRSAEVPIAELPRDAAGHLILDVGIRSFAGGDDSVLVPDAGVYPVTVQLRDNGEVIRSLRTNMVRLPTETAEIGLLPVSVLLPVSSADGLDLAGAATLLERHPSLPISVLLGPGVVGQLLDDPTLADRLRSALNGRKVIALPELSLDPSALASIGQGGLYARAIENSNQDLAALGLEPLPGVLPIDVPLTVDGASLLLDLGYDQIIDVGAVPQPGGVLTADGRNLQIIQVADDLSAEFNGPGEPAEQGHRLVARLAIRHETDRSPVLLGGDDLSQANPISLDIVLASLDQAGLLEAIDLRDTAASGLTVRPSESASQDLRPLETDVIRTLSLIDTYDTFHVSGGLNPSLLREELVGAMSRDLNPESRQQAVDQLVSNVNGSLDVISLPDPETVTLAAQNSVLTLTIENGAPGPRAVLLRFQSDKLTVDQNNLVIELPPGSSTIDIDIETRSVGETPLEMVLLSPDEQHELARTKIQVRSTAIPGLGMLLSATALVFLLIWWGRSIIRTRREQGEEVHAGTEIETARPPVGVSR